MKRLIYLPVLMLLSALAVVLMLPLSGCNTSGCTDNHSALPQMGFYNAYTKAPLTLDSLELWGVGAPGDSMLIKSGDKVQKLYFPLRYDSGYTAFCFHYDYKEQGLDNPEYNDTLRLWYTTQPYFASEECGAYYIYHITDIRYTRHIIDSIAVVDSVISNVDMERFGVYFRVSEVTEPDEPSEPDEPDGPEEPDEPGDENLPEYKGVAANRSKLVSSERRLIR